MRVQDATKLDTLDVTVSEYGVNSLDDRLITGLLHNPQDH
jgi:hypothetical protein